MADRSLRDDPPIGGGAATDTVSQGEQVVPGTLDGGLAPTHQDPTDPSTGGGGTGALVDGGSGGAPPSDSTNPDRPIDGGSTMPPNGGQASADAGSSAGGSASAGSDDEPSQSDCAESDCSCWAERGMVCAILNQALTHRYSFEGRGSTAIDSRGGANGRTIDVELNGNGSVELDGYEQYVELPNGLLDNLNSATLEAWIRWEGGYMEQSIFAFGQTQRFPAFGAKQLSLIAGRGPQQVVAFTLNTTNNGVAQVDGASLPTGAMIHVATVIDANTHEARLFIDGARVNAIPQNHPLTGLTDDHSWLGRPLAEQSPYFYGAIFEFRTYNTALTDEAIKASALLGPDAPLGSTADANMSATSVPGKSN